MGRVPPADVRRKLRQEVNFGCAICGAPLLEYHHIVPYSEIEHHNPDDMIALCPTHHQLGDDKAISRNKLYECKENPSNAEVVDYDFYFDPVSPIIPLGSTAVEIASSGRYRILQVEDQPIISIHYTDSRIEFDVNFYNESNDLIAVITDNEWWANTDEFWDIRYQSRRLKLWNQKYEVGFQAEFDPEEDRISLRGRFFYGGDEFIIHPSSIKYPGSNSDFLKDVGIVIGAESGYDSRIPKSINFTSVSEGVFLVNGKDNGFAFNL